MRAQSELNEIRPRQADQTAEPGTRDNAGDAHRNSTTDNARARSPRRVSVLTLAEERMLSLIKRMFRPNAGGEGSVALQPAGQPFPWPRGTRLTALEPVTLAIPAAAVADGEPIGSVIFGDADLEVRLPTKPSDSLIYLRLKDGSSVSLSKSVQGIVVADDKLPKRIRVLAPPNENKG